jgi:hypothetical protein
MRNSILYLISMVLFLFSINSFGQDVESRKKGFIYISYDTKGNHEASALGNSGELDVEEAFSIGFEMLMNDQENFMLGMGGEYQFPRAQKNVKGDFGFASFFASVQIPLGMANASTIPMIAGRVGYSLFYGNNDYRGPMNLSGGLYYGIGGGVLVNNIVQIELLYTGNSGTGSYQSFEIDVNYSKLSILLGVKI